MCILGVAINVNDHFPFIFIANRDESYWRPTMHAHFWEDAPQILAGKDLQKGGTWLGLSTDGSFAALTNVREKNPSSFDKESRGELVINYLLDNDSFLKNIENKDRFEGFNLLFGNIKELTYISNRTTKQSKLYNGIYVLSNGTLESKWPKTNKLKLLLENAAVATSKETLIKDLSNILRDETTANDRELPETGFELEVERLLSPIFIRRNDYGSRSSTIILVDKEGNCTFIEKNYIPAKFEVMYHFQLSMDETIE